MRRPRDKAWLALCATLLLAAAMPAIADGSRDSQPGVTWEQLSPDQQKVLGQFRGRWDNLPPGQQQSLMRGAERWESMTPEQRDRVKQRTERWQNMTPDEQQRARERAERFKQLSPEEQARLREEFRRYRDLPPEQREKARKQRQQGAGRTQPTRMRTSRRQARSGPRPLKSLDAFNDPARRLLRGLRLQFPVLGSRR